MDLKEVANMFSGKQEKVHWGSAYALWEIARFKVIGIPVLDLMLKHIKDADLKLLVETGTNDSAVPHVKKMQKFMMEHGMTYPPLPERNAIDDQQIARAVKEIIRLSLLHDVHAFISTTREDERGLIGNILLDDRKSFDKIISISRNKGWLLDPPNLQK